MIPAKAEPIRSAVPLRRFRYDAKHDLLKCPRGKILRPTRRVEHGRFFYSKARDCSRCSLAALCLSKGRANKAVVVSDDHPALLRARRRRRDGRRRTSVFISAIAGARKAFTARQRPGTGWPGRSGAGFRTCASRRY